MLLCPLESPCRVTQTFYSRPDVYAQFGMDGHGGIDLAGEKPGKLVPVFACYDAVVHEVGDQGKQGYGRFIRLRTYPDPKGFRRELVYGHLSSILVYAGQDVKLGDKVGIMGNTGFSSAPHLHLGMRIIRPDGKVQNANNGYSGYVDFLPFIRYWKSEGPDMVTVVG